MQTRTRWGIGSALLLMVYGLAACGGGSSDSAVSLDDVAEGAGPALSLSTSTTEAKQLVTGVAREVMRKHDNAIDSVSNLWEIDHQSDVDHFCRDGHVTLTIAALAIPSVTTGTTAPSTPDEPSTPVVSTTTKSLDVERATAVTSKWDPQGQVTIQQSGADGIAQDITLTGDATTYSYADSTMGRTLVLTGDATFESHWSTTAGRSASCGGQEVGSVQATGHDAISGAFTVAQGAGAAVSFAFTLEANGTMSSTAVSGTATIAGTARVKSGGVEVNCTISGNNPQFGGPLTTYRDALVVSCSQ